MKALTISTLQFVIVVRARRSRGSIKAADDGGTCVDFAVAHRVRSHPQATISTDNSSVMRSVVGRACIHDSSRWVECVATTPFAVATGQRHAVVGTLERGGEMQMDWLRLTAPEKAA